ncbi:SGNH/GDSL hydrolase family protein, partial [bacterium]|nr:SGNH/GDSL hydrolase family protein [bacterium]
RRGDFQPLGNGYVRFFSDLQTIREPEKQLKIINTGISGDRVTGLQNRWTDDVLNYEPDWLSIKIGINDLHSVVRNTPEPVTPDIFAMIYDEILARTREALPNCRLLLIQPFYISRETAATSFRNSVLELLPEYLAIVTELSLKYKTALLETHAMFHNLLDYHPADTFCPEPVHPNATGHLAIAEAVYQSLSSKKNG